MGCEKYNQKSELTLYCYSQDDFFSGFTAEGLHHTINRMGSRASMLFNQKKKKTLFFSLMDPIHLEAQKREQLGGMLPKAESCLLC